MARRSSPTQTKRTLPAIPIAAAVPLAPPRGEFGKVLVNWLFPVYVLMIATGYGLFLSGLATSKGNEIGSDRCLFHSINAASLTGFQATIGVHEFNRFGQWLSLVLMAGGALFSLIVGGLAMVRILRLPYSDRRVIGASFVALLIAAIVGTVAAMIGGWGFFDSLFLAVSSFSNGGLTAAGSPGVSDAVTHLVLLPLSIVGGLGVTVLLELFDRVRGRSKLSRHAGTTLAWLAGIYLVAFVVLLIARLPSDRNWFGGAVASDRMSWAEWRSLIAATSALAINSRSLGLPLEYATSLSRCVVWLLILLMSIGAGSGGTAGGIKVTTLAEFFTGLRHALRGERGRGFGIAIAWIGYFAAMLLVTQLLLLKQLGQMPADRVFFLATSALSNAGLSHDLLSITGDGLYTLSAAMFAGRVVPLLILWWMADTTTDAELAVG